jgi:hypothetical protein
MKSSLSDGNQRWALVIGICVMVAAAAAVSAAESIGTVSPVQSSADPYNLPKAGPVMLSGSTAESANFNAMIPAVLSFIKQALPEYRNNTASIAFEVDPSRIVLASQTALTAIFISEGAGYHNSIGFNVVAPGAAPPQSTWAEVTSPTARLIFPDASSSVSTYVASGSAGTRTASEPLLPGDFVNLGTYAKGSSLDFFLMANGANNSKATVFSSLGSLNGDGIQHVAAFTTHLFAVPQLNSPYLFLAFEDLWGGGDKDINDTIIAINVGAANVKAFLATPEPRMWLIFASFLGLALWAKRYRADLRPSCG